MDSKNRTGTQTMDLRKNGPLGKSEPQGLKTLPFFSSNMKDHVEVIYFHIKSQGMQDLVFVQTTFENSSISISKTAKLV